MAKKQRKATSSEQPDTSDETTSIVCRLKHEAIDKEFDAIKIDEDRRHEEIKELIKTVKEEIVKDVKTSHDNLKDKIVLVDKTVGDKIDSLSDFDDTLKGNGKPGVWESIRSLNKMVKVLISIMSIIVILELGGSVNKINWDKLREKIWGPPTVSEQAETSQTVKETKLSAMPKN